MKDSDAKTMVRIALIDSDPLCLVGFHALFAS